MSNTLFEKPHRRHVSELNIVPVLDMLTTIIFFLLLSTSFMEYSKVTVPPSQVSTITDPVAPPPLQPRLSVTVAGGNYRLLLMWSGNEAGSLKRTTPKAEGAQDKLFTDATEIVKEFKAKYPSEPTLQLGLGTTLPYQDLILIMDAVRETVKDIVLYAPAEAEAEAEKMGAFSP